jgi:hypothetical protein
VTEQLLVSSISFTTIYLVCIIVATHHFWYNTL